MFSPLIPTSKVGHFNLLNFHYGSARRNCNVPLGQAPAIIGLNFSELHNFQKNPAAELPEFATAVVDPASFVPNLFECKARD